MPDVARDEQESRAVGALLALIRKRQYEPGDRLPSERELAERFSIGRGALREALAKLENMRFIERRPNSGIFMSPEPHATSLETLVLYADLGLPLERRVNSECVEVRRIIEVQAIRLACERRTDADLTQLKSANAEFLEACAKPTIASDMDYQFHIAIFRATQNDILVRLVTPFYFISQVRRERFFADAERCKISQAQHAEMVKAIERRDSERAEKLMAAHIGRVEQYFDAE
jgi:GntR family transcriptional regulator, transcriptional repressor for pyruvate dehydrogenase complex